MWKIKIFDFGTHNSTCLLPIRNRVDHTGQSSRSTCPNSINKTTLQAHNGPKRIKLNWPLIKRSNRLSVVHPTLNSLCVFNRNVRNNVIKCVYDTCNFGQWEKCDCWCFATTIEEEELHIGQKGFKWVAGVSTRPLRKINFPDKNSICA